jgi:hypothetical protein
VESQHETTAILICLPLSRIHGTCHPVTVASCSDTPTVTDARQGRGNDKNMVQTVINVVWRAPSSASAR